MKFFLHKVSFYLFTLTLALSASCVQAQGVAEWRLVNPTFSAVDPDGAGPATGVVTFQIQIHAISAPIVDVDVIAMGWSYQSAAAMIPATQGCATVSNPTNVVVSPEFTAGGFTYQTVNQCGTFTQTTGGQTFDRRAVGTLQGSAITLTTAWVNIMTVTMWSLGNSSPHGGYVVINTSSSGDATPPQLFTTYSVSDPLGNEYGCNSLTYTTPLGLVAGPLPVTFSKYDVRCAERGTTLQWATAAEQGSSYFDIEKSSNGTDWRSIGRLSAAGNSSRETNYQYLDLEAGVAAYRIKQVDLNGRTVYTDIRRTSCETKALSVLLYPIPAKDRLTVAIKSDRALKTNFQVVDATGRVVYRQMNNMINAGNNNIQLDIHSLPAGDYILVSSDPSVYINQKFVIIK